MWKMHPKFQAGQYRAVVEELLDGRGAKAALARKRYIASLVGALCFLGRIQEAQDLADLESSKSKKPLDQVASRFFLGLGYTRHSEYEKARRLLEENERRAGKSALERFFVHQGNTFFHYYTGRLPACLAEAELSRKSALAAQDLFARFLATDALGHAHVRVGQIHRGLELLGEAEKVARRLGNQSSGAAIQISALLYAFEFGLAKISLPELEKLWESGGPENNYSQSTVALELARQLTLRGEYRRASRILEATAPAIYASQNRRQEIQLNLRLAELSGRKGAFFEARHFLWFCRRLLHREVDASLELMALGIERKLALAEGKEDEAARLLDRWNRLATEFPSTRDQNLRVRLGFQSATAENPEDRVHLALSMSAKAPTLEKKLEPLLRAGYLAEASLVLRLNPATRTIALLPGNHGLLIADADGVRWRQESVSPLQQKLLRLFGQRAREVSKEEMVETVWGYRYDPLRHDSMVYAALSSLRKALGEAGSWLAPTEEGYRLDATLWTSQASAKKEKTPAPAPVAEKLLVHLNHRQLEILEWLGQVRFASVKDCQSRFEVSEVTALRDLAGLWKQGVVVRIGKARATRYTLAAAANGGTL